MKNNNTTTFLRRRNILKMLPAFLSLPILSSGCKDKKEVVQKIGKSVSRRTIFLSTWNNETANKTAAESAMKGKNTIDAIVDGISTVESDPSDMSVGLGGRPDRDGDVTLDACMMDHDGKAGGVCFMSEIEHPIQVARSVMYDTPHVLLAGRGAQQYAIEKGHKKVNLLTEGAKTQYNEWIKEKEYKPIPNIEMHDTIGMIGIHEGNLGGGCSTSGLAYKMKGRVGDSPIIGAGLYVDGAVGACTATGLGELVLRQLSSFLVVEFMRNGIHPKEACKKAILRIVEQNQEKMKKGDMQVGLLAMDIEGNVGAYSVLPGFVYRQTVDGESTLETSESHYDKWE